MEQTKSMYKIVEDPGSIRKLSLHSAVETISLLENYEIYKKLRKKKHSYMLELKKTLKEVKELSIDLNHHIPETKKTKTPRVIKQTFTSKRKIRKTSSGTRDELTRLQREAQELKEKIANL